MAKPPTSTELKQRTHRTIARVHGVVAIGTALIKWGAIVAIFYFVRGTAQALAGKETFANIGVNLAADIRANEWIAYILGAGGMAWGTAKHALFSREKAHMTKRIIDLEKMITELQKKAD